MKESNRPPGLILAGGRSRRMGREKSLVKLCGITLLQRSLERFRPQVGPLALSANGDPARFAAFGLPVMADQSTQNQGPLAGLLAGLSWASRLQEQPHHIATVPCDTPFFPADLVRRLRKELAAKADAHADKIALPASNGRLHPAFGLWPLSLTEDLRQWLDSGERRVQDWLARHDPLIVEFSLIRRKGEIIDPFFNINHKSDLEKAEKNCQALEK